MNVPVLPPTERPERLTSHTRLWQDVEEAIASTEATTPQSTQPESRLASAAPPAAGRWESITEWLGEARRYLAFFFRPVPGLPESVFALTLVDGVPIYLSNLRRYHQDWSQE